MHYRLRFADRIHPQTVVGPPAKPGRHTDDRPIEVRVLPALETRAPYGLRLNVPRAFRLAAERYVRRRLAGRRPPSRSTMRPFLST